MLTSVPLQLEGPHLVDNASPPQGPRAAPAPRPAGQCEQDTRLVQKLDD